MGTMGYLCYYFELAWLFVTFPLLQARSILSPLLFIWPSPLYPDPTLIDSTMSDFFCRSFGLTSSTKLSVQAIFFKSFLPTKPTVFDSPAVLAHSSYIVLSFILHVHVVNCNCISNKHVNSNQIIEFCIKCQLCLITGVGQYIH